MMFKGVKEMVILVVSGWANVASGDSGDSTERPRQMQDVHRSVK